MFDTYRNDAVRRRLRQIDKQYIKQQEKFEDNNINLNGEHRGGFDTEIAKEYKKQEPKIGGGMKIMNKSLYRQRSEPIPLFSNLVNDQPNINMKQAKLTPPQPFGQVPLDGYANEFIESNDDLEGSGYVDTALKFINKAIPIVKKSLPHVKQALGVAKVIAQSVNNEKANKVGNVLESLGFGEGSAISSRQRRGEKIKQLMKEKGMTLIEASKYIKANNISY